LRKTLLAFVLAGFAVSAATAGQILVSPIGGGVVLESGPLPGISLGFTPNVWAIRSLADVHSSVNGSGIATDGKITILAADTEHGLSLLVMIDQQLPFESLFSSGNVFMETAAIGRSVPHMHDATGNVSIIDPGANSRTASGAFGWNSNGGGDGFAWAGLSGGDSMTFRFNKIVGSSLGLDATSTFQFLTWTNVGWQTVAMPADSLSFTETNDFGFAASVVPSPAGFAVAGLALLAPACVRRRRNG